MTNKVKKISLLGATGSIGRSTLDIVTRFPERYQIVALGGGRNISELSAQAQRFRPQLLAVQDETGAEELEQALNAAGLKIPIMVGQPGAIAVATLSEADIVVAAMVGAVGLEPTHAALKAGKNVALANKESMVMAGRLLNEVASANKVAILPLDSEHSALWQVLNGEPESGVEKLILTASGGPFREFSLAQMAEVTPE
ncbi:MAG: 1-deoxy-D-xylulose-5-phosphate reductoisomerase, partial [Deltaproteobacteria bacterium]